MTEGEREQAIKRMMTEGRIMDVVKDAVNLCGVERHKISQDVVPRLRDLITKIVIEHDVSLDKLPSAAQKEVFSITQNDLNVLVDNAMAYLKEVFETLEVDAFEETANYTELEGLVREAIDHEKKFRDEELADDRRREL